MSTVVMRLTCCWILGSVLHYETVDTKTMIPTYMFHYLDIYRFRIYPCVHIVFYSVPLLLGVCKKHT